MVTVVGEPADLSAYRGKPVGQRDMREVTDLLMGQVTALVAQVRGETPPTKAFRPAPTKPKRAVEKHAMRTRFDNFYPEVRGGRLRRACFPEPAWPAPRPAAATHP